jgi:hypothetical protein
LISVPRVTYARVYNWSKGFSAFSHHVPGSDDESKSFQATEAVGDGPDHHFPKSKIRYKQEALKIKQRLSDLAQGRPFQITSLPMHQSRSAKPSDIAAQRLEEERVIANVIGLAVVISVHFSKGDGKFNEPLNVVDPFTACARAVDFYLDEKYSTEKEKLVELCRTRIRPTKKLWNISGRHKVMF